MSESKHTPGPWEIRFGGTTESDDGFCVASKVSPEFGVIAEAWPPNLLPSQRGAMLANARLIAAAPELLDACERVAKALEDEGDGSVAWVATGVTAWELLTDAINKAKGGEA